MEGALVNLDQQAYHIRQLPKLLGILEWIAPRTAAAHLAQPQRQLGTSLL
jgi:hypothetical protein